MHSSPASAGLAVGVLLGGVLGALVGVLLASSPLETTTEMVKSHYGHASDTTEGSDRLVAGVTLGMLAGALVGTGAAGVYGALRRIRE
jgi:hypothetical protein